MSLRAPKHSHFPSRHTQIRKNQCKDRRFGWAASKYLKQKKKNIAPISSVVQELIFEVQHGKQPPSTKFSLFLAVKAILSPYEIWDFESRVKNSERQAVAGLSEMSLMYRPF